MENRTKICRLCNTEKPLKEFYKQSRNADGYEKRCKACISKYSKGRVARETPEQREYRQKRNREYSKKYVNPHVDGNKIYIQEYLQKHPCVDCGEDDWIVLEFDHIRGVKHKAISALIRFPINRIIEEIAKCEVRCANCHRRVTYQRAGYWRIVEDSETEKED